MRYLGDFKASDVLDFKFSTHTAAGAPATLSGTPAVSVYKGNNATQSTSGVTLSTDFDSVTGLNNVRIDTSQDGTFYAAGSEFDVVITTGTVDSVSVVGYVLAHFSIANRTANAIAAGAITATAIADNAIDAGAIAAGAIAPGKIASGAIVEASFGASAITASVLAADCITANKVATGAIHATAMAQNSITTTVVAPTVFAQIADDVWDEASTGHTDAGKAGEQLWTDIDAILTDTGTTLDGRIPAALVGGRMDSSIGTVAAGAITAAAMNADASAEIADAVWEETLADHTGTVGSTAAALNAAGSAGDPWNTALPGAYGAGSAGKIVGDNLNATVSSRATQTSVDTIDDYIDTEVAAIKAKTDNLPAAPAAVGDIPTAGAVADAVWDEATAGHAGAGSAGLALASIPTAAANAAALLDLTNGVETDLTPRQALRLIAAALAGELSGADTTEVTIKGAGVATTRLVATVDANGNRSALTLTRG